VGGWTSSGGGDGVEDERGGGSKSSKAAAEARSGNHLRSAPPTSGLASCSAAFLDFFFGGAITADFGMLLCSCASFGGCDLGPAS